MKIKLNNIAFTALTIAALLLPPLAFSSQKMETGARAEWDQMHTVLLHTPGEELFLGVANYEAALFDNTFDMDEAAREHRAYIEELKKRGAKDVRTVTQVLEQSYSTNKPELIKLALDSVKLDTTSLNEADRQEQRACFVDTITNRTSAPVLVRMIMQRPTIILSKSEQRRSSPEKCRGYTMTAKYTLDPVMNLYFTRDQMLTTAKGVVLTRMAKRPRAQETKIIKFVLNQLGIKPLYEVQDSGATVEGGDFIPAGERVFIGQGMRTNPRAIELLLRNDVFGGGMDSGPKEVVVVKDVWGNQQEMHLDTHFNIIRSDLAVEVEDRFPGKCEQKNKCLKADTYTWTSGRWQLTSRNVDFLTYIARAGFKVIPVSVADQEAYGINFLTTVSGKIIGVKGVSEGYQQALKKAGVNEQTWIKFDEMKLGFGAAHCTTQVLRRIPTK